MLACSVCVAASCFEPSHFFTVTLEPRGPCDGTHLVSNPTCRANGHVARALQRLATRRPGTLAAGTAACLRTPRHAPALAHRTTPYTVPRRPSVTTSFLTAAILKYTIGAGITADAGTRLALQLILVRSVWDTLIPRPTTLSNAVGPLFLVTASRLRALGNFRACCIP